VDTERLGALASRTQHCAIDMTQARSIISEAIRGKPSLQRLAFSA